MISPYRWRFLCDLSDLCASVVILAADIRRRQDHLCSLPRASSNGELVYGLLIGSLRWLV
jgi:hypothetical protein